MDGGAIYLDSTLKLILSISPAIKKISFIRNHADCTGGALYIKDSQCSLGLTLPIECFLSIYSNSSDYAMKNASLLFFNNPEEVLSMEDNWISVGSAIEPINYR